MAAATIRISIYRHIKDTHGSEVDLNNFLEDIREGVWQDLVLPIRAEPDKDKRSKLKAQLPNVTISGVFNERKDGSIKQHSNFIAIDIDDLHQDINSVKSILLKDPYVYACFVSVSGTGLCAIIPIDGARHRDAFEGIADYLYNTYQLIIDRSGVNESRARYASYDPHIHINHSATRFKKYLPKEKPKKIQQYVYVESDFDSIVNSLSEKNICEDYKDWVTVGYALASKFGASGENYYHILSQSASKYNAQDCTKQYQNLLRTLSPTKKQANINTIYHYAKIHGINIYSDRTKKILSSATILRKSGLDQTGVISNLQKFESIPAIESQDIVQQCFSQDIEHTGEDSIITQIENWLKYNHDLKRNAITRRIENNAIPLKETDINTLFLTAKKQFEDLTYDIFIKILYSDATVEYNPLKDFFERHQDRQPIETISNLFRCFKTADNTPNLGYYGTKWLVSVISAIHGEHSPLMLVFTGGQNTGKTEAFRRLLPAELRHYYAESKLDAGKDDDILMTQKLIIMDDEMGGKSKQESKRLKEMLSKQTFSLRVPYGKGNEDLDRLAVLCGTSNDKQILNDPTGNRRIIPIEVISIDQQAFNAIDKIDVFMEAYHLYKGGYKWQLDKMDIALMNEVSYDFIDYSLEYELIQKYLSLPDTDGCLQWSATEIKSYLERMTSQKISLKKLGTELHELGFRQVMKKINNKQARLYEVVLNDGIISTKEPF